MDGFIRHQIEGVSVDIQIVPATASGFAARFRVSGEPGDEADWPVVHVAHGPFATRQQAEEAAKSAALEHILERGDPPH